MKSRATIETTSVLIPTNGRPESLKSCLEAIWNNIHPNIGVIVLDSTISSARSEVIEAYELIYSSMPNVRVIRPGRVIPPGHARKILAEECQSEFFLFMDDDHEIQPGAFSCLARASEEFDIVSGRWIEDGGERPLCFHYHFSASEISKVVVKQALRYQSKLDGLIIPADDVLATMLCKRSVFERVNFDKEYHFFYELFDFFMDCERSDVSIAVAVDAIFKHNPVKYKSKSSRQTHNRESDRIYFIKKWACEPVVVDAPRARSENQGLGEMLKKGVRHLKKNVRDR